MTKTCCIDGCERAVSKRGWCERHYKRWWKTGDPLSARFDRREDGLTFEDAVIHHSVLTENGCREWRASVRRCGYPQMNWRGVPVHVPRELFIRKNGPIKEGIEVDHRCRNRRCVNVDHLRLATSSQNKENQGIRSDNTSGYRGVCWNERQGKWHSQIGHQGKNYHLGFYSSKEDAARSARQARLKLMTHNEMDR